jgi:hypothetical protein
MATTYTEIPVTLSTSSGGVLTFTTSQTITHTGITLTGGANTPNVLGDQANETFSGTFKNGFSNGSIGTLTYVGDTATLTTTAGGTVGFVAQDSTGKYFLFVPSTETVAAGTPFSATQDSTSTPATQWNVTSSTPACFLTGTRIATPAGDVSIEDLKSGDLVCTANGAAEPVRWVGHVTVARTFADPLKFYPVRIRAGALSEGLPKADLLVSPDHALFLDDVLVQAGALVNGSSIVRETWMPQFFTYYHVELAGHALVLSEGVAAETFIDNVDRFAFDNWAERQDQPGEAEPAQEMRYPRAKSERQLPKALRTQLLDRATALAGMEMTQAA